MTQSSNPFGNVRGAVDLSSLSQAATPQTPTQSGGTSSFTVDLDLESFSSVVARSSEVPVIVVLWVPTDAASAQLAATLDALATQYAGKFLHARANVQDFPQIAQAFQAPDYPTTVGLISGQPVPLFAGNHDAAQVQQVIEQFLAAAAQNGVTGVLAGGTKQDEPAEEEPLPPLHQNAYDAISEGDYDAAIAAYTQALREDPKDSYATAGLAQVSLLKRTGDSSRQEALSVAQEHPESIDAHLLVADFAVLEGDAEVAFASLIDLVREHYGDEREVLRKRLIEYFEILGNSDPRVGVARRQLASALY